MIVQNLLAFAMLLSGAAIADGANVYRAGGAMTVRSPDQISSDTASPVSGRNGAIVGESPQLTGPKQAPVDSLEQDLARVSQPQGDVSGMGGGQEGTTTDTKDQDVPSEDEGIDLRLLYDLIRAVEYEANVQLFNNVLQQSYPDPLSPSSQTASRFPAPPRAPQAAPPAVVGPERWPGSTYAGRPGANSVLTGPGVPAEQAKLPVVTSPDRAEPHRVDTVPEQPWRATGGVANQGKQALPLHKRLANALKEVPGVERSQKSVYPSGAVSATKRGRP